MKNKSVHISGWYAIISAIIGAVLSAGCTYYFTVNTNEISKQDYQVLQNRVEELESENESLKAQLEEKSSEIVEYGTDTDDSHKNDEAIGKTDIFSLLPFKENGGDFIYSSNGYKDNLGNTYPDGYLILYNHMVNIDNEVCYVLDQKYSTLYGTIALDYSSKDIKEGIWIEFYSNDKMIKQTKSLSSGVKPIEFSVDVSQVSELTIRINGGGYSGGILTQGFYLE